MYLSLSVVFFFIVKFSHKVQLTCLDDFTSEMLPVPPQTDFSFEETTELKILSTVEVFRRSRFFTVLFVIVIIGDVSIVKFPVVIQYFFIVNCCRLSHRKSSSASVKSSAIVTSGTSIGSSNFNSSRSDSGNLSGSSLSFTAYLIASKMLILGTSSLASMYVMHNLTIVDLYFTL